jgi:hypothetical protein
VKLPVIDAVGDPEGARSGAIMFSGFHDLYLSFAVSFEILRE